MQSIVGAAELALPGVLSSALATSITTLGGVFKPMSNVVCFIVSFLTGVATDTLGLRGPAGFATFTTSGLRGDIELTR